MSQSQPFLLLTALFVGYLMAVMREFMQYFYSYAFSHLCFNRTFSDEKSNQCSGRIKCRLRSLTSVLPSTATETCCSLQGNQTKSSISQSICSVIKLISKTILVTRYHTVVLVRESGLFSFIYSFPESVTKTLRWFS